MAVLTGTGLGNGQIQAVFGSPFLFTGGGDTGFTASNSYGTVSVTGTGLTYSSSVLNGQTVYQLTGGTITGVSYTNGPNSQTWSNISVSAAAAFNAILNFNAFNSLFFNGDDVFTWNAANVSGNAPFLYGYGGNDTFYIGDWDKSRGQYRIDGGSGDDTLYVTGGVGNSPYASFPPSSGLFTSQLEPLFIVSNVEIIKLGAGYDYTLLVRSDLVTSGNTTVVDATALGAPNRLIFDTNTFYNGQAITGDLVLLGGAGDDVLQGGTGTNTFNGGGGNDTVTFSWGQSSVSHPTGVTANLSLTGLQNFGTNWGTGTFISIENLVGSGWDDTLIGDSGDNLLTGGGGNDTLDGGAGYDTAIYSSAKSNYTISYSGHTVTIAGPDGTDTLTNVEFARFSDQTVQIGGPVVASASTRVAANQTITLSNLASISDLTGYAITAYQLWDSTSDPNSGHFVINGQVQAAGTIINVTAAQLAQTSFVTGTANDNLQIRALDANNIWSATDNVAWSPFSIGPTVNNLPVLTTHAPVYPNHFQTFSLSSLLSVTDADNDTMTRYQLWDGSRDPNSGHFVVNGQVMAAGTIIDITAAQAAQTSYVTGYLSDNLQIRAYDGFDWSAADNAAWAPFTVTVFENPPTVVTSDRTTWQAGQTVAATYLLNVSDTDQDPLTRFQFWDATRDPNSGYFVVNGQVQAAGTIIDLTPAQFAQTSFVVGSVADNIQVRVSDGYAWSASDTQAWAPFKVAPAPNHPPSVSTYYQGVTATRNQVMNWAQLTVQVIDPDGDPITRYQLWDSTADPNSGHFVVNNVVQPASTVIDLTAAQFAQTVFVTGIVSDNLQIRAFDGKDWSAPDNAPWSPFTVTVPDAAPVVATANMHVAVNQVLTSSDLATVTDADGDAITRYQLWDGGRDPASGYFVVNGVVKAAGTVIDISAAEWAQTTFVAGSTASDAIQIRAFDGIKWSAPDTAAWSPFTISPPINNPPIVTTQTVNASHFQTLTPSALFQVSDPDGDTITRYQLWDATRDPASGHFVVNGQVMAAGTVIDITAAQMAQTTFVTGGVNDNLQIRAFDGTSWSAADTAPWSPFTVAVPLNHAPVVLSSYSVSAQHDWTIALSTIWGVIQDIDGDPIVRYQLWDANRDPNSGYFVVNGTIQAAGTVIDLTPAQYAQTVFVAGTVGDSVQMRVFDGTAWSAADNAAWAPATITVAPNVAPVVSTYDIAATPNQTLQLSNLFQVSDQNGDTMKAYQLWDSTADPSSGHFVVNGVAQAAGTVIGVTAAQFSQTTFVTGTVGDSLQIRAFDGRAWSAADNAAWAPFHINVS